MALPRKNAQYRAIANTLEDNVASKIDRIAQLLDNPEIRRAITEARKEFLLNQPEEDVVDEDEVFEEEAGEEEEDDDDYDEFDWTTE
ncbi:hypothetical protein JFT91_06885 [Pseudomonas sp. TH08]|uniref:hypothetical protein n=1 Tax=unclassified Pseudomonas TaxID=196821 RepID=UPI001912F2DD|nr:MULTISPECIES: hypothetical protein [unclassified Pseudomonas]MBK5509642.1 hypothetical protein [Pseudomonas sp. TH15]MBK5532332.1 hypothetical protein [Pseudomonas sp. TH08]